MSEHWNRLIVLGCLLFRAVRAMPRYHRDIGTNHEHSHYSGGLFIHNQRSEVGSLSHGMYPRSTADFLSNTISAINIPLSTNHYSYSIYVEIDDQNLTLVINTVSADTWIADAYYTCFDSYDMVHSQSVCGLEPTHQSRINYSSSSPETLNSHFYVHYDNGASASGPMATLPMRFAKDMIVYQQLGIASNVMTSLGNNIAMNSGMLGLAYSALAGMYEGTDMWATAECLSMNHFRRANDDAHPRQLSTNENSPCGRKPYSSLSETLFLSNVTSGSSNSSQQLHWRQPSENHRVFTLALSRDLSNSSKGGVLSFGGVPNVTDPTINVTLPVVLVSNERLQSDVSNELKHYVISVDAISLPLNTGEVVANTPGDTNPSSNNKSTGTFPGLRRPQMNRRADPELYGVDFDDVNPMNMGLHKVESNAQTTSAMLDIDGDRLESDTSNGVPEGTNPDRLPPFSPPPHHGPPHRPILPKRNSLSSLHLRYPRSRSVPTTNQISYHQLTPLTSQFKIDSTSVFTFLPKNLTATYNSLFNPPAYQSYSGSLYFLSCDTLSYIPPLGFEIGGETFWHNVQDLVVRVTVPRYVEDPGEPPAYEEVCLSAIQDQKLIKWAIYGMGLGGGADLRAAMSQEATAADATTVRMASMRTAGDQVNVDDPDSSDDDEAAKQEEMNLILGQPFLKNVLVMFDVGRGNIGLASRMEYAS